MPDPTQGNRIATAIAALRKQGASEHDIETYLVEHEGLKPTEVPMSAARQSAKRFAAEPDATEHETGVTEEATPFLGALASLGRFTSDDLQTGARAMIRDRGALDYVKELGNTKGADLLDAMKYGPVGLAKLSSGALTRTPSYARAREDIRNAEESSGDVGNAAADAGAAIALAPVVRAAAGPVMGATRGGLAPLAARMRNGLVGKMAEGAWRGLSESGGSVPEAATSASNVEKLRGPMGNLDDIVRAGQPPFAPSADPKAIERAATGGANKVAPSIDELVTPSRQGRGTQARFEHFAQRMAKRSAAAADPFSAKLQELLAKARAQNPSEVPATWGDAEEAMGLAPHQQPDLEEQLRQSIRLKGGTPVDEAATVRKPAAAKPIASTSTRTPTGTLPRNLKHFTDDELEQRWHSLAERLGQEESANSAIQESGYRANYEELPRTEKFGLRGQEDLPDADGMVDAERLQADNRITGDYQRRAMVRAAQEKSLKRIGDELAGRGKGFGSGVVPFSALALAAGGSSVATRGGSPRP